MPSVTGNPCQRKNYCMDLNSHHLREWFASWICHEYSRTWYKSPPNVSKKNPKHVAHITAKFLLSHNCWSLPFKGWLWIDSGDQWQTSSLSKGVLIWVSVSNCVFLSHFHHSTKKWFGSIAFSLFQFHWTPCLSPCWAEKSWSLAEDWSKIRLHEIYDVTGKAHIASWIMVNHCLNQRLFTSWLS